MTLRLNRTCSAFGGGLLLAISCLATPSSAQTPPTYSKEAMQQALSAKHHYDLFGIHFDFDKATIQADSKTLLDDVAAALKSFPDWRLRIAGHTDASGDVAHNETLSMDRASAIKQALVERGIDPSRLEASGVGPRQPIATNDTAEGRALNRRVELARLDLKPNIIVIMGDDIGMWNIGAYHRGIMAGRTPNLDKLAKEGMLLHRLLRRSELHGRSRKLHHRRIADPHGHDHCGSGWRRIGLPAEAATIATVLKSMGYATGQFGKNHLGDMNEFLPTVHGFDEFFGYLYHLDAMEDPAHPNYPQDQLNVVGPRNMVHSWATDRTTPRRCRAGASRQAEDRRRRPALSQAHGDRGR